MKRMLSEDDFWSRLAIEAKEMQVEEPSFEPVGGRLDHWRGFIVGTGLYEGGVFMFEIIVPREYPFKPPIVKVITPIYHPNFYRDRVCVGILGKDWSPANNLVDVVESLRFLLNHPNPKDPLDKTVADLMESQPALFEQKVREMVEQYATWEQLAKFS